MAKFEGAAKFLEELNALWDEHAKHIKVANTNLTKMMSTTEKLPSQYIKMMKQVSDAHQRLISDSKKLNIQTEKTVSSITEMQLRIEQGAKNQTNATQKLTKAESDYVNAVERGIKAKKAQDASNSKAKEIENIKKLTQEREEALRKHEKITAEMIALENKKAAVLSKPYNSTKELAKLEVKFQDVNARLKESIQSIIKFDQLLHKTGDSSKLPGADVRIEKYKNQEKAAKDAAKEAERLAKAEEKEAKAAEKAAAINARLGDAYGRLTSRKKALGRELQNSILNHGKLNSETRKLQKEYDALAKKVEMADKAIGKISSGSATGKLTGIVGNLMGAFGISTGLYLAADLVGNIYKTTKALQSMDLALKMVSGTAQEFAQNQAFIALVSQKWGLEIKTATEQFTKFYTASKGILSDDEIKGIFESLAKSGSLLGASAEKQESTFIALEQMMSKGKVTAEELTKQLGNAMPGALRAMAMAYMELHPQITDIQKAEQALFADMRKGAIDSATYVPLYVKNYEKLVGIEMVNKVETLQASQNRLINTWTELVRVATTSNGDTVFGQTLIGITAIAQGLLNVLTKIISAQSTITEKSRNAGQQEAMSLLRSNPIADSVKKYGGATKADQNKYLKEQMNENYNNWVYWAKELNQKQDEFYSMSATEQYWSIGLKNEIEDAANSVGYFKELYTEYRDFIVNGPTKKKAKANAVSETETKKAAEDAVRTAKKAADDAEAARKDEYEALLSSLEHEKYIIEQKLLLKENSYSENVGYTMDLAKKEMEIAQAVYAEELRLAGKNKSLQLIADNKFYKAKIELAKDYVKRFDEIVYEPQYKPKSALADDEEKYGVGTYTTSEDQLANMVVMWKKQQGEKDKIAEEELDRARYLRDTLNRIFSDFGQAVGFEDTMEIFSKIGKNGKSFWENLTGKDGKVEFEEALLAGLTVAQDVANKITERKLYDIEEDKRILEEKKELALDFAGDSAAAKEDIEKQYQAKMEALNMKESKAKKAQAMYNIALDTAQAIVGLWVKPGFPAAIPLAIAVAALGATQLAMVASKSIPSFYTGTDDAPGGWANTDERGAELHLDKGGRIKDFGSNRGARIKYLDKGDKIIPAGKTAELLDSINMSSPANYILLNNMLYNGNKNNQLDVTGVIDSIHSLQSSIENKEVSEEVYDVRGWTKYKKISSQRIEEKNNRIRFKKSIL